METDGLTIEVVLLSAVLLGFIVSLILILWQVSRLETRIGQEVSHSLERLFQPIQKRGAIGEAILVELLKDILPSSSYDTQYILNGSRVDAVIKLESGIIPIDSKFPMDNYLRMIDLTSDDAIRSRAQRDFTRDVRGHIDDISGKYIQPSIGTFDFALMFIPSEAIYYEIATGHLLEYAASRRVFPVSPGTLYPYLFTIALGLRGMYIEAHAREIIDTIGQIERNYEDLTESWRRAHKQLANAISNLEDVMRQINRTSEQFRTFKYDYPDTSSDSSDAS